jgi:hypothetical protein
MPGWRPWKVHCAVGTAASDVAAVVVFLFGYVDGVDQTVGDPGVGGASTLAAPRSWFGGLTREQQAAVLSGMVAMPAGVVSLLGASLWSTSPCYGSG